MRQQPPALGPPGEGKIKHQDAPQDVVLEQPPGKEVDEGQKKDEIDTNQQKWVRLLDLLSLAEWEMIKSQQTTPIEISW